MQDAISDEDFDRAVIAGDGDIDGDFLAGIFEITVEPVLQAQFLDCHFEARFRGLVDVQFIVGRHRHIVLREYIRNCIREFVR